MQLNFENSIFIWGCLERIVCSTRSVFYLYTTMFKTIYLFEATGKMFGSLQSHSGLYLKAQGKVQFQCPTHMTLCVCLCVCGLENENAWATGYEKVIRVR